MLHCTNLLDIFFSNRAPILQKVYIILLDFFLKNSLFWSVISKYGQWTHFLKVLSGIIGYNFKIYDKFKKLTLVQMCCFIHYIFLIWIFTDKWKRPLYVPSFKVSFVFMHIMLGDTFMCLIYVLDNFHCLGYIHTAR
jgi:hypothetical protein